MEEFLKNEFRLIQCYRAFDNEEEATEKCSKYADEMKKFVNEGGLEYSNIMKAMWKTHFKTHNYYNIDGQNI